MGIQSYTVILHYFCTFGKTSEQKLRTRTKLSCPQNNLCAFLRIFQKGSQNLYATVQVSAKIPLCLRSRARDARAFGDDRGIFSYNGSIQSKGITVSIFQCNHFLKKCRHFSRKCLHISTKERKVEKKKVEKKKVEERRGKYKNRFAFAYGFTYALCR